MVSHHVECKTEAFSTLGTQESRLNRLKSGEIENVEKLKKKNEMQRESLCSAHSVQSLSSYCPQHTTLLSIGRILLSLSWISLSWSINFWNVLFVSPVLSVHLSPHQAVLIFRHHPLTRCCDSSVQYFRTAAPIGWVCYVLKNMRLVASNSQNDLKIHAYSFVFPILLALHDFKVWALIKYWVICI